MAKLRNTTPDGTHSGCKVWGFYRLANGTPMKEPVTVLPGQAGIWQGILYDMTPVIVIPDSNGRYEVVLPPSSSLGDYTVVAGQQQLTIRVPDDVTTAPLTALLIG